MKEEENPFLLTKGSGNSKTRTIVTSGPTSAMVREPESHSPLQGDACLLLDCVRHELCALILQSITHSLFHSATKEDIGSLAFCLYSSRKEGPFISLLGKNGM